MRCWASYLFILVVTTLAIGQTIAACGQKGDLYLPKPEQTAPAPDKGKDVPGPRTQPPEPSAEGEKGAAKTREGTPGGNRRA